VEGGSANDYDYVNGDPVNGLDLDGRAPCRGRPLWRQTRGGYTFTVCRVATSAADRAAGRVRIQVDLRPKNAWERLQFVASSVLLCSGDPSNRSLCSHDQTPTTVPGQTVSHTRRVVDATMPVWAFGAALDAGGNLHTFWARIDPADIARSIGSE
jgi:hypothetical protein